MKKRKIIKGVVGAALVLSMSAGTLGCGKKDTGRNVTDPALAKEGVFKYQDIDLGLDSENDYNIIANMCVDGNSVIVVNTYEYSENSYEQHTYSYTVDNNGKVISNIEFEVPDCSEYKNSASPVNYDDDYMFYDAVGGVDYTDTVVKTDGIDGPMVEVSGDNAETDGEDVFIDDGSFDDEFYGGGSYESFTLNNVSMNSAGNYVGVAEYYYSGENDEGEYVNANVNLLCGWDSNGAVTWTNNLSELTGWEWLWVNGSAMLSNGNYLAILGGEDTIACTFDGEGNVINQKSVAELKELMNVQSISATKDGKLLFIYYDMDDDYRTACAYFDAEKLELKEKVSLPSSLDTSGFSSITIGADTDFVVSTNIGIAKFNSGDADIKYFMNYINSDIDTVDISNIVMIDKEHFIGAYYNTSDYQTRIAYFSYVAPEDIPDKQVINMAVYFLNFDIRSAVIDFNKNSDRYRVVVTNYSQYATEDNYNEGYTRMNNDIIAGNIPDLIVASPNFVNYDSFASKGLLMDFDELFAGDEELKDKKYLDNVFDAYAFNGKHYLGIYSFEYCTLIGSKKIFGNTTSWTISDFKKMQNNFPADSKLMNYLTQESFMNNIMFYDGTEFIDVATGKCDFDSEDFVTLLEYAATLPAEENYKYDDDMMWEDYSSNYRSGKYILAEQYIYNPRWYQQSRYEFFDGEAAAVGFPSRYGDSSIISCGSVPIAILKKGNVEGAWEFVRQFFTEEFQEELEYNIPVLESSFDKWAAHALERNSYELPDGTVEYYDDYYYVDGVEHMVPTMTQAELDEMKAMIKACKKRQFYDTSIMEIIEEEASACLAGQKSAKEVASIIQSRVQLYINENN